MEKGNNSHKKKWTRPEIKKLEFKQTLGGPPPDELEDSYGSGSIILGS